MLPLHHTGSLFLCQIRICVVIPTVLHPITFTLTPATITRMRPRWVVVSMRTLSIFTYYWKIHIHTLTQKRTSRNLFSAARSFIRERRCNQRLRSRNIGREGQMPIAGETVITLHIDIVPHFILSALLKNPNLILLFLHAYQ